MYSTYRYDSDSLLFLKKKNVPTSPSSPKAKQQEIEGRIIQNQVRIIFPHLCCYLGLDLLKEEI